MSEKAEAKNNPLLPQNDDNVNEKGETVEKEVKEGKDEKKENEENEEHEGSRDRNEKSEKKKTEELKEKKKLIAIIFLSVLIVISIIIFALVFTFFPDYYNGIIKCKYKGNGEKAYILNKDYSINGEIKIVVNNKTYKNENPLIKHDGEFDVTIKIYSDEIEMDNMFTYTNIKTANMTSEKNTKIVNMGRCFEGCKHLEKFTVNGFYTNETKSLSKLFLNSINLKDVDLTNMNTSNITDMSYTFALTNIDTINLTNFKLSKVHNLEGIFFGCNNTKVIINKDDYDDPSIRNLTQYYNITFICSAC